MDEAKVRKAFDVAWELATKCNDDFAAVAFGRVFDAMLLEPWSPPFMATATGVDVTRGHKPRKPLTEGSRRG